MIKIVLFKLLAVGAMAQIPGLMGKFDLTNLPEGAMDKIKNLKPNDIKKALQNMPPEMIKMVEGMGMTEENIQQVVKTMPEDFDMSTMFDRLRGEKEEIKSKLGEIHEVMQKESLDEFKERMNEMGIDLSEGPEGFKAQILPKVTEIMGIELRNNGFDTKNIEDLRSYLHAEIRMMMGVHRDASDVQVREMLKQKIGEEMKVTVDQADKEGGLMKQLLDNLKKKGIDFDNLKESVEII